jgi:pimeloyl-ACP methyl ester carboxylesterase
MPTIDLAGRRLFYSDSSTGEERTTLLLIHGAGGSSLVWPPELREMAGARVIAPDLPGHGQSEPPGRRAIPQYAAVVESLAGALGVKNVVLAGHSMGGATALWLALSGKLRVRGLVLIGTSMRMPVGDVLLGGAINSLDRAADFIVEHGFAAAAEENRELIRRQILDAGETVTFGDFLACSRFDFRKHVGAVDCPALVIIGAADRMIQPRFIEALARELPHGRQVHLQGAGHFVMLERPKETAELVQRFVDEIL